jgi:hypothetical protein
MKKIKYCKLCGERIINYTKKSKKYHKECYNIFRDTYLSEYSRLSYLLNKITASAFLIHIGEINDWKIQRKYADGRSGEKIGRVFE